MARVILQTLPFVGFLEKHLPPFMELKRWEKSLAWRNTHLTCWNLFSSFQFWWFSFCFRKQQKSNILGWEVATWYSFPEPDFSITSNFGQNYHQRCFFILGNIFIFIWPSIHLQYVALAVLIILLAFFPFLWWADEFPQWRTSLMYTSMWQLWHVLFTIFSSDWSRPFWNPI